MIKRIKRAITVQGSQQIDCQEKESSERTNEGDDATDEVVFILHVETKEEINNALEAKIL